MVISTRVAVAFFAVCTAAAWILGFGVVHNVIYHLLGSPEQPTRTLWVALLAQSFLMGAVPGCVVPVIDSSRSPAPAISFVLIIFISILGTAVVIGGWDTVVTQFSEYGTWLFLAGAGVGSLRYACAGSDT